MLPMYGACGSIPGLGIRAHMLCGQKIKKQTNKIYTEFWRHTTKNKSEHEIYLSNLKILITYWDDILDILG